MINVLISHGAPIDPRDNSGDMPIHIASYRNNASSLTRLLQGGADINSRGGHGQTALMKAAQYGGVESVEVLLDQHADPTLLDRNQRSALDIVCQMGDGSNEIKRDRIISLIKVGYRLMTMILLKMPYMHTIHYLLF